jgi:hypothetical protein
MPSFQLKKQYKVTEVDGSTVVAIDRNIYLPVDGTVLIAVGGVLKTEDDALRRRTIPPAW